MSNLSDMPARKISANKYVTCPCGVRSYEGEDIVPLWCYVETCPCTPVRWPTDYHVERFGLDTKTLNRPGWEPGARAPSRERKVA